MLSLRSALLSANSGWSSTANLRLTCYLFVPRHFLSCFFGLIRPLPFQVAPVLIFHCDPFQYRALLPSGFPRIRSLGIFIFLLGVELDLIALFLLINFCLDVFCAESSLRRDPDLLG